MQILPGSAVEPLAPGALMTTANATGITELAPR